MYLRSISLQNFRSYNSKSFKFSKPLTLIIAPNASGKTNLIEAIHLLSTGESFRPGNVETRVQEGKELARIKGVVEESDEKIKLEIIHTRGLVNGQRTRKTHFSVNGVKKQKRNFVGQLLTVTFVPEDLRLITGSPGRRREFLNTLISQIDPDYRLSLSTYEQTLRKRNRLLWMIQEGKTSRTALTYWTQSLLKHGSLLQTKRQQIITSLSESEFPLDLEIQYIPSVISQKRLDQYADKEILVGHTMIGPHKDDFVVKVRSKNKLKYFPLYTHGSRGEQRMGVLWLKTGAFEVMKQATNQSPVLLLDDIFSELDTENQKRVLSLTKVAQTIVTGTQKETAYLKNNGDFEVIKL